MNTRRMTAGGAALALALVASSCGGGGHSTATPPPTHHRAHGDSSKPQTADPVIIIRNFAFQVPRQIQPGATVKIRNDDTEAHTVTSDTRGTFDVKIDPGATAELTVPNQPGTYPFHCTYHANMHGKLTLG